MLVAEFHSVTGTSSFPPTEHRVILVMGPSTASSCNITNGM